VRIVNGTLQLRPTSQLRLDGSYIQQWYQRLSDETVVGVNHIPRLKLEYQVTRSIFVRVVGEYVSQQRDSLRDDGRSNDPILIRDPMTGSTSAPSRSRARATPCGRTGSSPTSRCLEQCFSWGMADRTAK
jgi:hypothetical protein